MPKKLFFIDLSNGNVVNGTASNSINMSSATNFTITPCQIKAPLVVIIVGLPFRGKSFAAHKISRNLFWKGEDVKVFQVEEKTSEESLKYITEWFETGHNVAVRIIEMIW
jgi:hypothetical protein